MRGSYHLNPLEWVLVEPAYPTVHINLGIPSFDVETDLSWTFGGLSNESREGSIFALLS